MPPTLDARADTGSTTRRAPGGQVDHDRSRAVAATRPGLRRRGEDPLADPVATHRQREDLATPTAPDHDAADRVVEGEPVEPHAARPRRPGPALEQVADDPAQPRHLLAAADHLVEQQAAPVAADGPAAARRRSPGRAAEIVG